MTGDDQRPAERTDRTATAARHVVVIGAGAVGCASAIECLRAGHRVTLLDPADPGDGHATNYGNAGWLSSHSVVPPALPGTWKKVPGYLLDPLGPLALRKRYLPRATTWLLRYLASGWSEARVQRAADALRTLLVDAAALHAQLAHEAGVPALIEQRGLLHVYRSRAEFEGDALAWRVRRRTGIGWTEWKAAELRRREPDLDARYTFAVFVAEAGHCRDPGAYVAALAAHALASGATRIARRATGFRIEGGHLRAVTTAKGEEGDAGEEEEIACDAAVVTTGARSKPLAAAVGCAVPLESERGYHVMLKSPGAGPRTPMMAADAKLIAHWMDGGLRVAGQVEIAGLHPPPDWRRADVLREHMLSMFPTLPRELPAEQVHRWMGHRPSLPDGLPCIGPSNATRDVVLAFGHGHIGLGASARTGRLVAQLVSGGPTEIALAPFAPQRFSR